jgi:hypothetical protein
MSFDVSFEKLNLILSIFTVMGRCLFTVVVRVETEIFVGLDSKMREGMQIGIE